MSQQVDENSMLRPTFSPGVHTDSSFARERPQSKRKSFSATPALMGSGGAEAAPAFGRSPLDAIATVTGTGDAVAFTTSSARSSSYHAPTPVKITTIVEMRKKRDRAIRGSYKLRVYRSRGECNRTAATNKAQSVGDPGTVPSQKREMGTDHCTIAMV